MDLGVLGTWAKPDDTAAWGALALAGMLAWNAFAPSDSRAKTSTTTTFLVTGAFVAAALSLGYVGFYLRGGPRIVDASTYWLQARALSEGHVAWPVPDPSASFRGRFLLYGDGNIAGIFPPGYPILLALGFLIGVPMIIGPLLAAAIAVATYTLAREIAIDAKVDPANVDKIARAATGLSLVCAALRYHTADTMAHGASALAVTLALAAALRARRGTLELRGFFGLAGLGVGYVAATRFASALPIGLVVLALAWTSKRRALALTSVVVGAIPWLAVLALVQQKATGHALVTPQSLYYATSDGPPGCFRYGFGAGIGCMVEHGDFVRARLHDDYGLLDAIQTTGRRLGHHIGDIANFEPLAILAILPLVPLRRASFAVRAAGVLVLLQILAYAPFYFDGDYPGGGARFFADVLPIEHALVAFSLLSFARWFPRFGVTRSAFVVLALACLGFAVHESHAHQRLADRDGGRPMFEPDVLTRSGVKRGLLFIDSDHGFALAHDPASAHDAVDHLVVARLRDDDHDRLLFERLGRPTAYAYRFRAPAASSVADLSAPDALKIGEVSTWSAPPAWTSLQPWRFEGESDWPPLAQTGGAWAEPIWASNSCASSGRALAVHGEGTVRIALPVPRPGRWHVSPRLFALNGGAEAELSLVVKGAPVATWKWSPPTSATDATPACIDLDPRDLTLDADADLVISAGKPAKAGLIALDRTTLTPSR